jgi:hypothetical protein
MDPITTLVGAVIIAIFAALPGILTGYAAVRAANNAATIAQKAVKVSEETLDQTKVIHVAVNSNLAALKQELSDSNKLVVDLRNTIAQLVARASEAGSASTEARLNNLEKKR